MADNQPDHHPINVREHPELYRIGRGEQGVMHVEPYKSELLPLWRFKTSALAEASAAALWARYLEYQSRQDFPGMDMARKYLQMGYTRARRYANHRGGRKWNADRSAVLPLVPDPEKARAAAIFKAAWDRVRSDSEYQRLKAEHQARYESQGSSRGVVPDITNPRPRGQ